jgi:hypothetical protein
MSVVLHHPHAHTHASHASMRWLRRWAMMGLGVALLVVGAVGSLLPGHLGLPVLVVGLAVVLRSSFTAKRKFVRLQRRHPNWVFPLRRLMRREPQVLRVMWHASLRTERFIFRRRLHALSATRRWLKRAFKSKMNHEAHQAH